MNLFVAFTLLAGCTPEAFLGKPHHAMKAPAAEEDAISVFFSPKGGAMGAILAEIRNAKRSIDVQAYLITSIEIVDALDAATARGVHVRVILDKNNWGGIYSAMTYLSNTAFPVWRDGRHKDAHDKILLIDGSTIITGSFNFTNQSEDVNAENLLVIRNKPILFRAFQAHFDEHLAHSTQLARCRTHSHQ